MSLFGSQAPKFQDGDSVIYLNHCLVTRDEPQYINLLRTSVVNQKLDLVQLGYYWIYEVRENLFKYNDPGSVYSSLMQHLYHEVILYRYRDLNPIRDSGGNIVNFLIYEMTPAYLDSVKRDYDVLIIKFQSTKPVDMSNYLQTSPLTAETGTGLLTETGGAILGG